MCIRDRPVDTPLIRPATVAALAKRHAAEGGAVLYPRFRSERGHPPLIPRHLFDEILAGDGEGGLRALLQRHACEEVDVADAGILLDMDTPEDYERLAALATRRQFPTAQECEALLAMEDVPERVRRHCRAVAAVATALSRRLDGVDGDMVSAAALLHDIAKGRPAHAATGAARVAAHGFPLLADAVRRHMDLQFAGGVPDAAAVVFAADKLVFEDRRVPLEARFAPAFARFAEQPEALRGARRRYESARAVLAAVERQAGAKLDELLDDCGVPA
jgi:putative nucleotidyltransferase with HDIG domain